MNAKRLFFPLAVGLLFVIVLLSVRYGSVNLSLHQMSQALFHFDTKDQSQQIIHNLRLPRTIGAVLVGASFATAGAMMQGISGNPLADSGLLGINAGGGLGLAVAFVLFQQPQTYQVIIASFIGSAISVAAVFFGSQKTGTGIDSVRLLLLGTALSAFFSAISQGLSMMFNLNQDLVFWYVGGTANITWAQLQICLPIILLALGCAFSLARGITLVSLGDELAIGLGKNPSLIRGFTLLVVLVLAGTSVTLVGTISFVGLIVPHVIRFFVGNDYRYVLPASAIGGAILVTLADVLSRFVQPPLETPMGVLLAIIGVPFLLFQVRRGKL